MRLIPSLAILAALSACTAAQMQTAITDGQLVCQVGSAYQAMRAASGQAILAKGAPAAAVQQVCGLVGGAAVALPSGATPAAVTIALPPSLTIPLASPQVVP